jgi:hypothetical protein
VSYLNARNGTILTRGRRRLCSADVLTMEVGYGVDYV